MGLLSVTLGFLLCCGKELLIFKMIKLCDKRCPRIDCKHTPVRVAKYARAAMLALCDLGKKIPDCFAVYPRVCLVIWPLIFDFWKVTQFRRIKHIVHRGELVWNVIRLFAPPPKGLQGERVSLALPLGRRDGWHFRLWVVNVHCRSFIGRWCRFTEWEYLYHRGCTTGNTS